MAEKKYYSVRTGKHPYKNKFDLPMLIRLFRLLYDRFTENQYFNEAFGTHHDEWGLLIHDGIGYLHWDMEAVMFEKLRKVDLWPIQEKCDNYSEEDLFDVIEFLFDHVSMPTKQYVSGNSFDHEIGQKRFRDEINELLSAYEQDYELSPDGEIRVLPDIGFETLVEAKIPETESDSIESKVEEAKKKYFSRYSTLADRRDAIRNLFDILELMRPKLKGVITKKDDGTLFTIANEFGIRHHNEKQKTDYEQSVWYSWMFYYYLATIHAVLRLLNKSETSQG